jgi:penicillin amidase
MKTTEIVLFSGMLIILPVFTMGFASSTGKPGRSSPQYEGVIAAQGLTDSVTVYRDERGMPHIYANNEHDLYFTVGYVSAQERLWQMDLIRRSSTGRLCEIFGDRPNTSSEINGRTFLEADMFARCLQIKEKSKIVLEKEDPEILICLEAFIDGVNTFINSTAGKLPIEFRILSYSPEPWTLEDIANIVGFMGWNLTSRNLTSEIFSYQLVQKLGVEKASLLLPDWRIPTDFVYPDFKIDEDQISQVLSFASAADKVAELGLTAFSGSNNWAVSGKRTETGKPILSNDMHLTFSSPGIWLQMHQVIPGKLNVTGVLIPGQPFIIAGHNEKIAWGMTNLMVDDVDLYSEKINPENHNQYLFNGEWRDMTVKKEVINIKKGRPDTVAIRFTHRGAVVSEIKNINDAVLSMRWSGYDYSDEIRSVYLLNRANGWDDFRTGLRTFRSLSQNFVYADVEGNIGLNVGAGVPIRKNGGIMVQNGETDEYDWKGYVPFEQLPFSFNPGTGYVSSANNKTTDDDYPYYISLDFVVPYRINRIRQMLGEKEIFGIEEFKQMITDQHSDLAALMMPYILRLNNRLEELAPLEASALSVLKSWNCDMNAGLIAPSIFEFFRTSFRRNLLSDDLGDFFNQLFYMTAEYYVYRILKTGSDDLVDNINTPEKETVDDIVMQSFKDGIKLLSKQRGKNMKRWKWGDIHTITVKHPLGSVKILNSFYHLNSHKYGIGGSDHTVNPYFSFAPGFKVAHGASERHILNTSDWDESFTVIPGGDSGIPSSEFYLSQLKTYLGNEFYKDCFSDNAVRSSAKYTLILQPVK